MGPLALAAIAVATLGLFARRDDGLELSSNKSLPAPKKPDKKKSVAAQTADIVSDAKDQLGPLADLDGLKALQALQGATDDKPSDAVVVMPDIKSATTAKPVTPAAKVASKPAATQSTAQKKAQTYLDWLKANAESKWGLTKATASAVTKQAQVDMGGGVVTDGIYGPKTKARGETLLNKHFPNVPAAAMATSKASTATAAPVVKIPAPPKPAAATQSTAQKKAQTYLDWLNANASTKWGLTKATASAVTKQAQVDMGGGLVTDGIYGPKTKARGETLLNKHFPNVPPSAAPKATPKASTRSAETAANDLFVYLTKTNAKKTTWGTKGAPNAVIQSAQKDMGGGLVTDGIYGPKTQARGKVLLGKAFPTR